MSQQMRLAVFASGGGSNFQSLLDQQAAGAMPHVAFGLLVASKEGIGAIAKAKEKGIPHVVMAKGNFLHQEDFDQELLRALENHGIEGIVLAGYLGILSEEVVARFPRSIVNIHPALIPSFCGKGFYGRHVHEAVIASGCKISGATVHFVDGQIDTGAILMQESVPVYEDDTASALQERVLEVEHRILPIAVEAMAANEIDWIEGRAYLRRTT